MINQYRKVEQEYADRIGLAIHRLGQSTRALLKGLHEKLRGKQWTVLVVPHSENKRVLNFRASAYAAILVASVLVVLFLGSIAAFSFPIVKKAYYTMTFNSLQNRIATEQRAVSDLVKQRQDLETVLSSEHSQLESAFAIQIGLLRQFVLGSWIGSFISGVASSLFVMLLTRAFRLRGRKRKKRTQAEPNAVGSEGGQ